MVHPGERKWIWGFAALVIVLTTLPYWIGFAQQGSDWHFTGFVFGVSDGNSYIAKMLRGSWGDWLFRTPYTAYPQKGIFLFFPYLLLGKLAGPPAVHIQLVSLYHLYRMAAGFLVIFATYDFVSVYLSEIRWRRFATVLAVLGGGFGWLSIAGLSKIFAWGLPLESYSPEAFGFLSIYGLPHLAAARAMLLWGLRGFLLRPDWSVSRNNRLRTGLVWAGISLFQPIIAGVGLFIVAIYLLLTGIVQTLRWRSNHEADWGLWKKYLLSGIAIALFAVPQVAYTFLSFKLDPTLNAWETQSIIGSPPPLDYLLGYGVVLPFSLLAVRPLLKQFPWHGWLLAGWLLFAPLAAYGPVSSQRRFLDGFWVALAILAVYWISKISNRTRKFALAWMTLAFPTTLFLLTAGILFSIHPTKPIFRPADEVQAFEYLAGAAQADAVVLAADDSANALPAWAPVHTLVGHGPESINGEALRERVECFYTPTCSDTSRKALLDEFKVVFVLWGPGEREIGTWNPNQSSYLQPVFQAGEYTVFEYQEAP